MKNARSILFVILISISLAYSNFSFSQKAPLGYFNGENLQDINLDILNDKYGKVSSLIIYQGNRLVYEKYYGFAQASTLHPISSVTKSITSLAVGICIDQGFIPSLDVKVCDYFPEYEYIFKNDINKKNITLKHLLTQTSGFEWDEWSIHYSYAGNPLIDLTQRPSNWIPQILSLPLDSIPGSKFTYNSACSDIIKLIVSKATGKDFKEFVVENIFKKMNISLFHWDTYPNNGEPAWGGISLTTRDMAKVGMLVNNNGSWGANRIVSKDWISISTIPKVSSDTLLYGFHWWIGIQPDGNPLVYAAGYGDQYVFIAPDKSLVIAINSKNFTDHAWEKKTKDLIDQILKAYVL
jgi:CubicO group peptidase (beta-lactamase class C family)